MKQRRGYMVTFCSKYLQACGSGDAGAGSTHCRGRTGIAVEQFAQDVMVLNEQARANQRMLTQSKSTFPVQLRVMNDLIAHVRRVDASRIDSLRTCTTSTWNIRLQRFLLKCSF